MPALELDVAFVHMNRADAAGNGQYLGPDPYFDDLFCMAAKRRFVTCERLVPHDAMRQEPHRGFCEAIAGLRFSSATSASSTSSPRARSRTWRARSGFLFA